jgi:lipid II:glycine glycyltransferase (peptidoglycan interpeptide bridge formation enzyme)
MFATRVIDIEDKENYNRFICGHPKGHFLQLWEWGQVKKGTGWMPLPLVLERDGEICGAMMMLKRKLPVPKLNKCILYAPRGPVIDIGQAEWCRHLFMGAQKVARNERAIFIKIDPDIKKAQGGFTEILRNNGFRRNETGMNFEGVQPNFVFRLNVAEAEETLLAAMHSKWRYNIRLADKKGVTVRIAQDKGALPGFYSLLKETAARDKFLVREYAYFEWIWDYMVEQGFAKIFLAEYQEKIIAAALVMITGGKAWYLYGASSNDYRNVMPNYLIQWEMIRWAKGQGCHIYDFRGVSGDLDESNPLYGLYKFKKGFNGELTEFVGEWDLVNLPVYYWLWNNLLPHYQKLSRRKNGEAQEAGKQ